MNKNPLFNLHKGKKTPLKTFVIGCLAGISALYLLNPTAGFFEFIPDAIPFVGNLDEITAVMLLLGALKYFGIDLADIFNGEDSSKKDSEVTAEPRYEPPTKS